MITPYKKRQLKKNLLSNFNKEKRLNVSFDELISISTEKKRAQGITDNDIITELQNKVNQYKQIFTFKQNHYSEYINVLRSFEKYFMSYFQKVTEFDMATFVKLKEDFEKIQMTYDNNVLHQAEEFEWEIFQSSTNNFFDYLQNSLNKIKEINMKEITEGIIIKAQNIDIENEVLISNQIQLNTNNNASIGVRQLDRFKELSSKKEYLNKKHSNSNYISHNTNELFKSNFKHVYLIKDNLTGKIRHLEFEKEDIRKQVKRGKWTRIALYISKNEMIKEINDTIDNITNTVLSQYILLSKEIKNENRLKLIAYGKAYSLNSLINDMKTILNDKLTHDSIIKVYYYNNHKCALMKEALIKIHNDHHKEYNITTNIDLEYLNRL